MYGSQGKTKLPSWRLGTSLPSLGSREPLWGILQEGPIYPGHLTEELFSHEEDCHLCIPPLPQNDWWQRSLRFVVETTLLGHHHVTVGEKLESPEGFGTRNLRGNQALDLMPRFPVNSYCTTDFEHRAPMKVTTGLGSGSEELGTSHLLGGRGNFYPWMHRHNPA